MNIPYDLKKVRDVTITEQYLIDFEEEVKQKYEAAEIRSPVHLTKGNEKELIEIFQYIHSEDWVLCGHRNHYHALLHGVPRDTLMDLVVRGRSMSVHSKEPKLYSSSIVGGTISIALGTALALKRSGSERRAWCFIGDMAFETGIFYEAHKYATNFNLPLTFIVEDNNMSTNTPTDETWNYKKRDIPYGVIYYQYERGFPHHGTGNWVLF